MKRRARSLPGVLIVAALLAAGGPVLAQVTIDDTQITVAGEEVVSTPTCSDGQVPKRSGGDWVCGTSGGVDNTGLCTLYSLSGQIPDVGLGCPVQQVKYIFATNGFWEGNLDFGGGVVNADILCGLAALFAGLPGSPVFLAWIASSDPTSAPASRFTKAPATTWYTLPSGRIVAIGWNDLTDGQLEWGIGENENGVNITTPPNRAWTNVNRDGTQRSAADGHCVDWTDGVFDGTPKVSECTISGPYANPTQVGYKGSTSITTTTYSWTEGSSGCCDDDNGGTTSNDSRKARLICVQQ